MPTHKSAPHHLDRALPANSGASQVHWEPNTDVYITDHCLVIRVELAGIRREQLEVTVEGERLIRIRGHRADVCRPPNCRFLVMNISYGPFERMIELPPGYDLTCAKAVYLNGFLQIDVPPIGTGHNTRHPDRNGCEEH